MKRIIHLDSADYQTGSNNNEPKLIIDFPFQIGREYTQAKMRLKGYNIPNSFHQVSSALGNNIFLFEEDDGNPEYQVPITSGWYNYSSLIAELQSQIAALLATSTAVTVSFNSISGKLTFTSDGTTDIKLNLNSNKSFADLIGFDKSDGTFSNIQTGSYSINLVPIRFIYLKSSELEAICQGGTTFHSSNGQEKILYTIQTTGDYQDINIKKENISDKYDYIIQGSIPKYITLRCFDRENNLIDLQNIPWSIEIEFVMYK